MASTTRRYRNGHYRGLIRRQLSGARYRHSLRVFRCARKIARANNVPWAEVGPAALLHDWAREWSTSHLLAFTRMYRALTASESRHPVLCHAFVAAQLARNRFPYLAPDTIDAISAHTLGHAGISPAGMVLFCADYLEPGRHRIPGDVRKHALHMPLEKMVLFVIEHARHAGLGRDRMTKNMYHKIWLARYQ